MLLTIDLDTIRAFALDHPVIFMGAIAVGGMLAARVLARLI